MIHFDKIFFLFFSCVVCMVFTDSFCLYQDTPHFLVTFILNGNATVVITRYREAYEIDHTVLQMEFESMNVQGVDHSILRRGL